MNVRNDGRRDGQDGARNEEPAADGFIIGMDIPRVLREQGMLVNTTVGISMFPMLRNRRDVIVVKPLAAGERLAVGDVALYWVRGAGAAVGSGSGAGAARKAGAAAGAGAGAVRKAVDARKDGAGAGAARKDGAGAARKASDAGADGADIASRTVGDAKGEGAGAARKTGAARKDGGVGADAGTGADVIGDGAHPAVRAHSGVHYVLHRVVGVRDGWYAIRGDNCLETEHVDDAQVLGRLVEFYRGERHVVCDSSNGYRLYWRFWLAVWPVRRLWKLTRRAVGRALRLFGWKGRRRKPF